MWVVVALGFGLIVVAPQCTGAGEVASDSAAVAVADSSIVASADSTPAPAAPSPGAKRGMQDTVTTVRGITVEGARKQLEGSRTTSVTTLDRAALRRFAPSTAAEALVTAPGVELIKTGPWASRVSFRGFQGERLLVMVDGVRLNTGRGHGSNTSLVAVDDLDAVNLTAGASSAEYGSDAIGGVINLVTHRPLLAKQSSLGGSISAQGSEPGDAFKQNARLRFLSKHFGAEAALSQGHHNELVTPLEHVTNSGSHDEEFSARAVAKLGEGTLDFEHMHHAARNVGLPALNGSYPLNARDAERLELQLPVTVSVFGWALPMRVRALGSDQLYRTIFDEMARDTVISARTHLPLAFHATQAEDRVVTRSQQMQPGITFGNKGELRLGGELRRETTSGPKLTTVTTTSFAGEVTDVSSGMSENVPTAQRDVRAGSTGTKFSIGALRVEGGARYDWIRARADSTATSWSPPLAIVDGRWSLDGGLAYPVGSFEPYARVASGFRAPNLEERYYRGPIHGNMDVFGNPNLRPERNVNYEAGVRADADGWGTMRVSAYRTLSDDFITLKYLLLLAGRPRFIYANARRVQIDGLEFSGRARLHSTSTQLTVTLPRGRDLSTGDQITDVGAPRVTTEFTTSVGHWLPAGMLALRASWSNGLSSDARTREQRLLLSRPAHWAVNAEVSATVAGARATLVVFNLFNNSFREPLSFIDEPGRTYTIALKRSFQMPLSEPHKERTR